MKNKQNKEIDFEVAAVIMDKNQRNDKSINCTVSGV